MAVREIINLPDKRLRLVSEPVKQIDAGIRKLVDDMFETMYDAPGIGLAAIQIGVAKRVVTMDLSKKEDDHKPQVFINPEITWKSDETANTRKAACRSRNITRRSSGRPRSRSNTSTSTARRTRSRPRACWRPACSTRSTTPMACCSSITSPSSNATASSRNSPRRPRRRRREWRSASSSWARRISPCPRFLRLSARGHEVVAVYTRAPQPAGRGMALNGQVPSRARPSGSACRSSRRRL